MFVTSASEVAAPGISNLLLVLNVDVQACLLARKKNRKGPFAKDVGLTGAF